MQFGTSSVKSVIKHGRVILLLLYLSSPVVCDIYLSTLTNQTRYVRDVRQSLRSNRQDRESVFSPEDISPDGEIRAPVLLGVRRDLTVNNGPEGLFGVCHRVYRVLYQVRLGPARECQKHRSRQSVLGDISDFYHTLMENGRFNQTLEFPLADHFSRFVLRASFVYLPTRANEPAVLIETKTEQNLQHSHVLCVESIRCPEPTTTTTTTTTTTPAVLGMVIGDSTAGTSLSLAQTNGDISGAEGPKGSSTGRHTNDPFWDTLLSGTEPKSWFLATVSLGSLCLLLLIILLITWLYVCRLKRLHARRRCRGTCRFGCRCPSDVIRQTVTDAAVCGPLDSQNHHLFASPMTPQGNGSLRSGSGFGTALYPAGTMTSSRWGSNGVHKMGTPLYVSLANASDKTALLAANYPNAGCIIQTNGNPGPGSVVPIANSVDNMSGTWSQLNGQRSSSHVPRRRLSQDALHRSTSDGSSVSDHVVQAANNSATTKGSVPGRGGIGVSYLGGPITSMPATVLITAGNAAITPQSPDASSSIYYQQQSGGIIVGGSNGGGGGAGGTTYSYTDSGRGSGISPGLSQSPTRLNGRKLNDRGYYVPHGSLEPSSRTGTVNEEEEDEPQASTDPRFFNAAPGGDKLALMPHGDTRQAAYNLYGTDSLHPNAYTARGSEGDLLNITPPSGFYDPNGSGGTDSGLVNGSSSSSRSNPHAAANSFGQRTFLAPLYPILGSPVGVAANEWSGVTMNGGDPSTTVVVSSTHAGGSTDHHLHHHQQQQQQQQHMVGAMDAERLPAMSHGAPACSEVTNAPYGSAKPIISSRLYTASERLL